MEKEKKRSKAPLLYIVHENKDCETEGESLASGCILPSLESMNLELHDSSQKICTST